MRRKLSRQSVENLLTDLQAKISDRRCRTCVCFQTYVGQLQSDAVDAEDLILPHLVPFSKMTENLDCRPCPPSDALSRYLRDPGPHT